MYSLAAWYFFYVGRALQYPMLAAHHPEVSEWQGYTNRACQIVFMVLMLLVSARFTEAVSQMRRQRPNQTMQLVSLKLA
jgi:hypothetical protein